MILNAKGANIKPFYLGLVIPRVSRRGLGLGHERSVKKDWAEIRWGDFRSTILPRKSSLLRRLPMCVKLLRKKTAGRCLISRYQSTFIYVTECKSMLYLSWFLQIDRVQMTNWDYERKLCFSVSENSQFFQQQSNSKIWRLRLLFNNSFSA